MQFSAISTFLLLWQFHSSPAAIDWSDNINLEVGRQKYSEVLDLTKHPTHGACWLQAVERLQSGCKRMTPDLQSQMAFLFTNCFLETSRQSKYSCSEAELETNNCITRVTQQDFLVYSGFYRQTTSMCFFINVELWNRKTEMTMNSMVDSFTAVSSKLKAINAAMEDSRTQTLDIVQVIISARERIFSDLGSLYTATFYFFFLGFSVLLTTTRRTRAARFWLFCLFMSSLALEYFVVKRLPEAGLHGVQNEDVFLETTWFIRKTSIVVAIVVLVLAVCKYRDLDQLSLQLIKDTNEQICELNKCFTQAKMFAAIKCNGMCNTLKYNGTALATNIKTITNDIAKSHNGPSYLSSDDETFLSGKSERSPNFSFAEMDRIPVLRGEKKYTRRTITSVSQPKTVAQTISPSYHYNLRNRSRLSSPDNSVLSYESPEMFSITVHRVAKSTEKQSAALRHALMQRRLQMRD